MATTGDSTSPKTDHPPQQPVPPGPPPAYYPASTQPVVETTGYTVNPPILYVYYGVNPVRIRCQHCYADIVTSMEYSTGDTTWLACLAACFLGLFLGCCLIPFCVNGAKDVIHRCPNCEQQVGIYRRRFDI